MKKYIVYYNDDGILIQEPVEAPDQVAARKIGQDLHPDLQIVSVKLIEE